MEKEQDDEYIDKSSELGRLIVKVNQLEKRYTLDNALGEILNSFLRVLTQSEDYLISGIFKINFAEAALLLQGSAYIYSKKIDLLWDTINECQKRLISYKIEENQEEFKRIEERERKYKRRRKQIEAPSNKNVNINKLKLFPIQWDDVDNFQHSNSEKDSKLYSGWSKKMLIKWDLQPTPKSNRTLSDKQIQFRSPENAIFDEDQDNEFVVYMTKMESVIGLEEMLLPEKSRFSDFSFQLYTELDLIPKFLMKNNFIHEDLEKHSIELEKFIEIYKDQQRGNRFDDNCDKIIDKQTPQKLRKISISSTTVSRVDMSDFDNVVIKKCQVNLLRLSVDDLSRMSRLSVDEVKKSFNYEGEDSKSQHFQENFSTENKVDTDYDSSSQIAGEEDIDINISYTGTGTNEVKETSNETGLSSQNETCESQFNDSTSFNITKEVVEKTKHTSTRKRTIEIIKCLVDVDIPQKRKKFSKAALKKLAAGITVDLQKFNSFFAIHYKPEEGEEPVELAEFSFDDPIDSSSAIDLGEEPPRTEDLEEELSDRPVLFTQDSGYESHFQDTMYQDEVSSPLLETDNQIPKEPLAHGSTIAENFVEDEEKPLYQRVYEWKQYMSEKFKQMKSTDFDIHEYGANIMESFEEGHPQKFGNVVKGKSAAEVTRFFISALQLANTSNIEIQGAQSGKLSNETFQLKLISNERYYDRLKDYMAPSEQDYHKRLSSAQEMHKKRSFPSTSVKSCSVKRYKRQ